MDRGLTQGVAVKRAAVILLAFLLATSCGQTAGRRGLPTEVESAINTVTENIAAERYEEIYRQAADLWRNDSTLEESTSTFRTLRDKLGRAETRNLHTAIEQENASGPLKGRVYIVTYQTRFEREQGMETFTMVEREGEWRLARYFVSSTGLK